MINGMEIRLQPDLATFVALAGPLYRADPVTHTVALTVLEQPLDFHTLLTVHRGGTDDSHDVVGAALRTPPSPLAVSGLPEAAAMAAASVRADHDPGLDQVFGPRERAEAFAEAWCTVTGAVARTLVAQRGFRLGELVAPAEVAGSVRSAGPSDLELAWEWQRAFAEEATPHSPAPTREKVLQQLTGFGCTLFWELPGGEPVAMARASTPLAGMSRITWVYTPTAMRGHGYGSAVTAAASRWALDAGASDVVLFTDLSNPTTNAIYPRLGYRPVHDAVVLGLAV
jgi:predicted GNAT family acetyltransferase